MSEGHAKKSRLVNLFAELRRRRVFRTSAIYVAGAWVIIQVVDTTFPIFELPEAYTRFVTIGLIVGFPLVVALSWIFDIGPMTLVRTPDAEPTPAPPEPHTISEQEAPDQSIAVMPFANLGQDPDNEFFSDGISEEVLNLLGRVPGLKVPARTSSFALRDSGSDARTVAKRLGVRHLLEGSVRRVENRVRIGAQLVDAESGYTLWSSRFDRDLHDIFAVQDEIAACILDALKQTLEIDAAGDTLRREAAPTSNMEAYQCYLRGLYLWQRRGQTAIEGAISALEAAVELDAEFAEALTLLATAHAALHEYSGGDREAGFSLAEPLARRSLSIKPEQGMPHAVLAYMAMRRWDWPTSARHFQDALDVEASDPTIHVWYSNLLNDLGYRETALDHAHTAWQLDRLSPQANNVLALNFVVLGRDEAALKHVAVAREFGLGGPVPDYVDYFVSLRRNRFSAAAEVMTRSLNRRRQATSWVAPTIAALEDPVHVEDARAALADAAAKGAIAPAIALMQYVLLGLQDETFAFADAQLEGQKLTHLWLFLPEAEALRTDHRFLGLMSRMGILDHWKRNGWPALVTPLQGNVGD